MLAQHTATVTYLPRSARRRSPVEVMDEVVSIVSQQITDRIAAEDSAWSRTPPSQRQIHAGYRCIVVERRNALVPVPLMNLTAAELDRVLS